MGIANLSARNRKVLVSFFLSLFLLLPGCGTMPGGRRWGEDANLTPGWSRAGESALEAATSPMVFIPAAATLLLQIGGADNRLSDWAVDHTPIAGSNDRAEDLSKNLGTISTGAFYLSLLAAPSGSEPVPWGVSKLKGAAVQGSTVLLNHVLVNEIKGAVGRDRPNGDDDRSFPSSMAADSAVYTSLAARNIDTMNLPGPAKTGFNLALHALTFAVAWERVEAGAHHPADVLASIALGCFTSRFINDSFMGIDAKKSGKIVAGPRGDGIYIGYSRRF